MFLPESGERNAVRLTYAGAWRPLIANWGDIAWSGVRRLQSELARGPDDPELAALLQVALEAVQGVPRPVLPGGERVLCPHFAIGGRIVWTMTAVAQFGAAQDITLDELRIELIYPADSEAADFFAELASVDVEMPS